MSFYSENQYVIMLYSEYFWTSVFCSCWHDGSYRSKTITVMITNSLKTILLIKLKLVVFISPHLVLRFVAATLTQSRMLMFMFTTSESVFCLFLTLQSFIRFFLWMQVWKAPCHVQLHRYCVQMPLFALAFCLYCVTRCPG